MEDQIFSEKEIARIIRRAAQLESEQLDKKTGTSAGLNLNELSKIAADAGLDPENIRIAAREIQSDTGSGKETSTDPALNQVFAERWVDGKFSDEIIDSVIADLRHRYDSSETEADWFREWHDDQWDERFGKSGVQRTGRSIEWKHIDHTGSIETRVLIQPRGKQIRLRVSKRNLWESPGGGPGNEIYELIGAVPLVTAIVLVFALPFDFFINLLASLIIYIGLQLAVTPFISKIREKLGGRLSYRKQSRVEENNVRYHQEVERLAEDISAILKSDLDDSMIKDPSIIEINQVENHLRERRKNSNR
jgi:hypothetical protein